LEQVGLPCEEYICVEVVDWGDVGTPNNDLREDLIFIDLPNFDFLMQSMVSCKVSSWILQLETIP
jgi:hypothetical protein